MGQSAYLSNLQALDDLQLALSRFAYSIQEVLTTASAEAAAAQTWVDQRVNFWQRQVQQAEQELRQAQATLHMCLNQASTDRDGRYRAPDCRSEEREVMRAEVHLRETQVNLVKAQQWQMRLEAEVGDYRRHASRLQDLATVHAPRTHAFLERVRAGVEEYTAERMSGGAASDDIPILSGLAQTLVAPLPGETGQAGRSAAACGPGSGKWIERGIQTIRVADLPDPDDITSGGDFHKVSSAEMRDGLQKLQTVRILVDSGEGVSSDYWAAVDRAQGLEFASGYQRVYEAFYGQDAIKVTWDGSAYEVVNGRHRIRLAKQLGIETLPMRLTVRL